MRRTRAAAAALLTVLPAAPAAGAAAPPADRTPPRVVISGLPKKGCAKKVRFSIAYDDGKGSGIATVRVYFDGKLVGRGKGKQRVRVRLGVVHPGRHRLGAVVTDRAGNVGKAVRRFRVCG